MLDVKTRFTPFRMKISKREPVQLSVEVTNKGNEKAIVSLNLGLGAYFSLEKGGYKTNAMERIPEMKPGETRKFYYDIWPKQSIREGENKVELNVVEHHQGFNYVKNEYKKNLGLIVEK